MRFGFFSSSSFDVLKSKFVRRKRAQRGKKEKEKQRHKRQRKIEIVLSSLPHTFVGLSAKVTEGSRHAAETET